MPRAVCCNPVILADKPPGRRLPQASQLSWTYPVPSLTPGPGTLSVPSSAASDLWPQGGFIGVPVGQNAVQHTGQYLGPTPGVARIIGNRSRSRSSNGLPVGWRPSRPQARQQRARSAGSNSSALRHTDSSDIAAMPEDVALDDSWRTRSARSQTDERVRAETHGRLQRPFLRVPLPAAIPTLVVLKREGEVVGLDTRDAAAEAGRTSDVVAWSTHGVQGCKLPATC